MKCPRCYGMKKLCYNCLSKLVTEQQALIERMQKTADEILKVMMDPPAVVVSGIVTPVDKYTLWRHIEQEQNCKLTSF